jgi:hypothetical protein
MTTRRCIEEGGHHYETVSEGEAESIWKCWRCGLQVFTNGKRLGLEPIEQRKAAFERQRAKYLNLPQ